jgi:hypothetical protein
MYWNPYIIYNIELQNLFKDLVIKYKDKILELKNEDGPIYDIFPEETHLGLTIVCTTKNNEYVLDLIRSEWVCIRMKETINGLPIVKDGNSNLYFIEGNVTRIINRLKHHQIYPHIDITVYSLYELGIITDLDLKEELGKEELWEK